MRNCRPADALHTLFEPNCSLTMKGASEANASESLVAPGIDAMVRERGYITLGEAKRYATSLPRESRRAACGCYVCHSPSCPGSCLGVSALLNFYCCLLYNPFLCACPADVPGAWTCTDMKGIKYDLVPVDERGTLAWFSGHQLQAGGDATKVSCYCTKMC